MVETFRQAGLPDADAPAEESRPSIAVLPFENLSSDPEQEFLADGMADDIISGLSKYRWLFVIAPAIVFHLQGPGQGRSRNRR